MSYKDYIIIFLLTLVIILLIYVIKIQTQKNSHSDRKLERIKAQTSESFKGKDLVDNYQKNEVKNTILKNAADAIQSCYKKWLEKNPNFVQGKVTVDWQILPDGKVDRPEIVSSEISDINACILSNIAQLEFPPPPDGEPYYVVHKFFFKNEEKK